MLCDGRIVCGCADPYGKRVLGDALHEPKLVAGTFNHVSGYVADVTWKGLSTQHVREGLEPHVTLEELRGKIEVAAAVTSSPFTASSASR